MHIYIYTISYIYTIYIHLRHMHMGYSIHILYRTVAGLTPNVTILPICCAAPSQAPCQADLLRAHLLRAALHVAGACTVCRSRVLHVRLGRLHQLQVEVVRDGN